MDQAQFDLLHQAIVDGFANMVNAIPAAPAPGAAAAAAAAAALAAQPPAAGAAAQLNHARNKKVPALTDTKPDSWFAWRETFTLIQAIAGWDNTRSRMEAAAAMQGDARTLVGGIPTEHAPAAGAADAVDFNALLDVYQALFQPPLSREYMMETYTSARQEETESIVLFAARLKQYFVRLFPNRAQNADTDEGLLYTFREGVQHQFIRDKIREQGIITLTAAVATAQTAEVTMAKRIKADTGELPEVIHKTISAMGKPDGPFQGTCFICSVAGHRQADCPVVEKAKKMMANDNNRQSGGGKSRRDRDRKKPYNNKKSDDKKNQGN